MPQNLCLSVPFHSIFSPCLLCTLFVQSPCLALLLHISFSSFLSSSKSLPFPLFLLPCHHFRVCTFLVLFVLRPFPLLSSTRLFPPFLSLTLQHICFQSGSWRRLFETKSSPTLRNLAQKFLKKPSLPQFSSFPQILLKLNTNPQKDPPH